MIKHLNAKLGNMRKDQEFIVYPAQAGDSKITIQSDHRICVIDPQTRKGMLSKQCHNPGFIMASRLMGATEIDVPQEVIDAAIGAQPQKGDTIGNGIVVIG